MSSTDFRDFVYPLDHPRRSRLADKDATEHAEAMVGGNPQLAELREQLISEDFVGITADGEVISGLYRLQDDSAPTSSMVETARVLLDQLNEEQRREIIYDIDAVAWRRWLNAEYLYHPVGLRLEELEPALRDTILEVVRASLNPAGFEMVRDVMRFNGFLGELVEAPLILNEWSYNFSLFGTPSAIEPWGWAISGHHLAISCFVLEGQMVLSPTFYGAEPNYLDEGEHQGRRLFEREEQLGLDLIQSLSAPLQRQAVLYDKIRDPSMAPGRVARGDQLHLAGAYRDNRVIPYEGVRASQFSKLQRRRVMEVAASFLKETPAGPLSARLRHIEQYLEETYLCWIGSTDGVDPFYFRIQSPVVLIEFDQHAGTFLSNKEPERFHIHTIVRTPNGNDYGRDLLRLHYEQKHR